MEKVLDYLEQLDQLIEQGREFDIIKLISTFHPADIAELIDALEEEKKKRFLAERDAAWKDVAFRAAHKLGNPLDAVDTFLQSLKKRIHQKKYDDAHAIATSIEDTIREELQIEATIHVDPLEEN